MPDPAAHRGEIKALTSLRGLAALAVVLQHFSATAQFHAAGWIPSLVPHGYMAVDFFFVLSGFIMSYTYLAGFETLGWRAYGSFLWKRVARIFPLGIAVTLLLLLLGAVASWWDRSWVFINWRATTDGLALPVLINLLHLQGFFPKYNLNDPSWSVSVEFVPYLLFPLLIGLAFRVSRIVPVLYGAAGIAVLLLIASRSADDGLGYRGPLDLLRCVAEFGFGMLAYRAFDRPSPLRALGTDFWTYAVSAACVLGFLLRADLALALVFPFVVLAFALNHGAPSRLLSSRVPYFLGTISFSIYLMHHLFRLPELMLVQVLHPVKLPPREALLFAAVGSLSVIPFAALAYYGVEKPGRHALNGLVRRVRRPRLAAAGAIRPPLA